MFYFFLHPSIVWSINIRFYPILNTSVLNISIQYTVSTQHCDLFSLPACLTFKRGFYKTCSCHSTAPAAGNISVLLPRHIRKSIARHWRTTFYQKYHCLWSSQLVMKWGGSSLHWLDLTSKHCQMGLTSFILNAELTSPKSTDKVYL